MAKKTPAAKALTVDDLLRPLKATRPDPNNTNLGTPQGQALIAGSMRTCGFARPVFAAADGTIIGGNHAMKTAEQLRAEGVLTGEPIYVHTNGDRPIIHVRDDLKSADDPRAVQLGIVDNQSNRHNYNPDVRRVQARIVKAHVTPAQVGFTAAELEVVTAADAARPATTTSYAGATPTHEPGAQEPAAAAPDAGSDGEAREPSRDERPANATLSGPRKGVGKLYMVVVSCEDEPDQRRVHDQLVELGMDVELRTL